MYVFDRQELYIPKWVDYGLKNRPLFGNVITCNKVAICIFVVGYLV